MSSEEKEGKQRNEEIDRQLRNDKMMQRNEIKMLLLGACPVYRFPDFFTLLNSISRCRRVWQVYNPQANEAHPRRWLYSR